MQKLIQVVLAVALIAAITACTVHTDSHMRKEAEQNAKQATDDARRAADEAKRAGEEAAAEGRRAADDARRSAEDTRREAQQQAADARREAEDARRDAMAETRNDRDNNNDHDQDTNGQVVNINSANAQQIIDATGVTAPVAQKIIAVRPYVSKRDLVTKRVVDEQTYWNIQKHVTVMK